MKSFISPRSVRKHLSQGVAALAIMAITSAPVMAHSITQTLVDAYNNSNLLQQNRALLRASDEDVAIAVSVLRPQISASAQASLSDPSPFTDSLFTTIDVTASLLLYDFGQSRFGIEAAKEAVLATRANLDTVEQQILLSAVQAYVAVLRDARVVQLGESNVRLITHELRAARDRFEVGEVTRTDVAQAEASLAAARGNLADAQGDLGISQAFFLAAVGVSHTTPVDGIAKLPALPSSVEEAQNIAVRTAPTIRQLQHQISANEFSAAAAEAAKRPTLTGTASVGDSSTQDFNGSIGLSLNIPIYQGGQLSALSRQATAAVHASRAGLKQSVLTVRQNVSNAWVQLRVAKAQVVASERQVRAARIAFDGVREEATLGARTTLDVLDAEQVFLDARTNLIVFQTQVFEASYTLLFAMGQLSSAHLKLPVERYDTTEYFNAVKSAPVPITKQGRKLQRILNRYGNN